MIISHRHEFVFLKPRKVAGTSVEVALSSHCAADDIVTPIGSFNPTWDEDSYVHRGRKWPGYSRHATVASVRKRLGERLWQGYFKFSIVRNPWDLVVSQYHWATRGGSLGRGTIMSSLGRFVRRPRRVRRNLLVLGMTAARKVIRVEDVSFPFFARYLLRYYQSNDRHYFAPSGSVAMDHLIRYENLESDFRGVCDRLGIPHTRLPSLKSKARPDRRHYSTYFDEKSMRAVARMYRRQIEVFGYDFEEA